LDLADAARPQAIHEDSRTVRLLRRLVCALQPDVRRSYRAGDDSGDLR
jgi:hypothetical protein